MEDYYSKQVYLPHFASYNRQRGSGIGALAAGIGRVALPFAKNFILPAAKKKLAQNCSFKVSLRSLMLLQSKNRHVRLLKQL